MARLLGAQQVACASNFQVPHGDFEAGAKFGKVPDCGEALLRNFRQTLVRLVGKVGVGVAGGASNPAPELMELAQAQTVGVF